MLSEHDEGDELVLVLVIPPQCLHAMLAAEIKGLIPIIWVHVGTRSKRAIFGGLTRSFILREGADRAPKSSRLLGRECLLSAGLLLAQKASPGDVSGPQNALVFVPRAH